MSVYQTCRTVIKNTLALKRALIKMGIKEQYIDISDKNDLNLRGYYDNEKILVAVRVRGKRSNGILQYYDFGWSREADGTYTLHTSDMDKALGKTWQNKLLNNYIVNVVEEVSRQNSWSIVSQNTETDGTISIHLTSYN